MGSKVITLPDNTASIIAGQSVTSANILCKYMDKPEYLHEILKASAIKPRYVEEIIDYLNITGVPAITIPMICFCDIPFSKVSKHTENYGQFGIALYKVKCFNKNVQPVTYINPNSNYFSDFRDTINTLMDLLINKGEKLEDKWSFLSDFMLTQLVYSKPIVGDMNTRSGKKKLLFKDECEWRYIPKLPKDMDLVLKPVDASPEGREIYNKALASKKCRKTWFRFTPDEICYLIVPNESEASNLIDFINSGKLRMSRKDKNKLISKIEITSKIVQDF